MLGRSGLWLTKRQNREGPYRYSFQPSRFGILEGWRTIRLHGKQELPITTEEQAIVACKEIARIYLAGKQGRLGFGPHLIDELKATTRNDYRLCLEALVERFGSRHWNSISTKDAKTWIREKAATHLSIAAPMVQDPSRRAEHDAPHPWRGEGRLDALLDALQGSRSGFVACPETHN